MTFLAGERITATRLNRLQPVVYGAIGTSTVAASSTNTDVPSATVSITNETVNAVYKAWCVWDFNATGIPGASSTGRMSIDGVGQSPLATFRGDAANERGTVIAVYEGVLTTAATRIFKLIATTSTNVEVQGVNSSITVEITEVA